MLRIAILPVLSLLLPAAYGCSCVPGSFDRSETAAILDDFCWSFTTDVYVATVLEATCNCVPGLASDADADLYCQSFSFGGSGSSVVSVETVSRAVCEIFDVGLRTCSELQQYDEEQFSNLVRPETTVTATGTLPPLVNNSSPCEFFACPFNNNSSPDFFSIQPCAYTVTVDRIFKDSDNNSAVGDSLIVPGPDVLTSCGAYGRVVELGRQYVVGIGGACNPISEWTALSAYSSREVEFLEQLSERYADDPTFCAGPKLSLFHFSLPLLLALIPVLLSS